MIKMKGTRSQIEECEYVIKYNAAQRVSALHGANDECNVQIHENQLKEYENKVEDSVTVME